ncbi:hypothetical protein B0H19DRAFT_1376335 [Mycena capillaripes]|nr:hypothetical protein B0H19DRAFT_1376335 [Mycena capillaripes]
MAVLTAAPPKATAAPLEPRTVTIPPTQTSGIAASNVITESHSARPSPSHALHSEKQHKAPVGLIVGVALAIVAAIAALFFIRYLFVRRARRREQAAAFSGAGHLASRDAHAHARSADDDDTHAERQRRRRARGVPSALPIAPLPLPVAAPTTTPAPAHLLLLPIRPAHQQQSSWPTAFSGSASEPGAGSSPAARQAYLAAELRAAQSLLERGGKEVDVKSTKARIRALEERQTSAWALGLE